MVESLYKLGFLQDATTFLFFQVNNIVYHLWNLFGDSNSRFEVLKLYAIIHEVKCWMALIVPIYNSIYNSIYTQYTPFDSTHLQLNFNRFPLIVHGSKRDHGKIFCMWVELFQREVFLPLAITVLACKRFSMSSILDLSLLETYSSFYLVQQLYMIVGLWVAYYKG